MVATQTARVWVQSIAAGAIGAAALPRDRAIVRALALLDPALSHVAEEAGSCPPRALLPTLDAGLSAARAPVLLQLHAESAGLTRDLCHALRRVLDMSVLHHSASSDAQPESSLRWPTPGVCLLWSEIACCLFVEHPLAHHAALVETQVADTLAQVVIRLGVKHGFCYANAAAETVLLCCFLPLSVCLSHERKRTDG